MQDDNLVYDESIDSKPSEVGSDINQLITERFSPQFIVDQLEKCLSSSSDRWKAIQWLVEYNKARDAGGKIEVVLNGVEQFTVQDWTKHVKLYRSGIIPLDLWNDEVNNNLMLSQPEKQFYVQLSQVGLEILLSMIDKCRDINRTRTLVDE